MTEDMDASSGVESSPRALARRLSRERRARLEAERLLVSRCEVLLRHKRGLEELVDTLRHDLALFMLGHSCLETLTGSGLALWGLRSRAFRATEGFYRMLAMDPERDALDFDGFRALLSVDSRDFLDEIEAAAKHAGSLDGVLQADVSGSPLRPRRWRMAICFLSDAEEDGVMLSVHSPAAAPYTVREPDA